ncbi:hypothetical protein M8818_005342 [Zalaria obscura]|uniref:Uncharacterized protein n=1 Tax=Zalaria obscura TaxID=2024903 RepID=A0ACC3SA88_9PEZI
MAVQIQSASRPDTGTTGPYNPQFEQLPIGHGVYPDGYEDSIENPPEAENMQDICERLACDRSSLSPSQCDEAAFKQFQRANRAASDEQDVMTDVVPTIRGNTGTKLHKGREHGFEVLVEFGTGIADAKPDGYGGTSRKNLDDYIVPSTWEHLPAAPNNFPELKGPSGRSDALRRRAVYAGAVGTRSMFELRTTATKHPCTTAMLTPSCQHIIQREDYSGCTPRTGSPQYYTTQVESATASGSPVSSRTEDASFEASIAADDYPAGVEEPPKRQRRRSAAVLL